MTAIQKKNLGQKNPLQIQSIVFFVKLIYLISHVFLAWTTYIPTNL